MTAFKKFSALALTLLLTESSALAQGSVREYRRAHEHEILREFLELLAIPNVASDRENIRRNAAALITVMQRRKLQPRLLEASDPAAPPAVYGEWKTPGATRTLIFYAHYDGQPTDPRQWTERPGNPCCGPRHWKPAASPAEPRQMRTSIRVATYGRSAADNKAG